VVHDIKKMLRRDSKRGVAMHVSRKQVCYMMFEAAFGKDKPHFNSFKEMNALCHEYYATTLDKDRPDISNRFFPTGQSWIDLTVEQYKELLDFERKHKDNYERMNELEMKKINMLQPFGDNKEAKRKFKDDSNDFKSLMSELLCLYTEDAYILYNKTYWLWLYYNRPKSSTR
jgi:hypothetical protein